MLRNSTNSVAPMMIAPLGPTRAKLPNNSCSIAPPKILPSPCAQRDFTQTPGRGNFRPEARGGPNGARSAGVACRVSPRSALVFGDGDAEAHEPAIQRLSADAEHARRLALVAL